MAHKQSYVESMQLKKQRRLEAGLVSERFPEVSDMVIHMTYYQKGVIPVQMVRIVNVFTTSYAYFNMECMIKGCIDGGFDLTSEITDMIKNRKKSKKGKLICSGKSDTLPPDHASIAYEITIKYKKR